MIACCKEGDVMWDTVLMSQKLNKYPAAHLSDENCNMNAYFEVVDTTSPVQSPIIPSFETFSLATVNISSNESPKAIKSISANMSMSNLELNSDNGALSNSFGYLKGSASQKQSPSNEKRHDIPLHLQSKEAPARINSPLRYSLTPIQKTRKRADSMPDIAENTVYCRLEVGANNLISHRRSDIFNTDLPNLVKAADIGLKCGFTPILAEGAMGGTYFLQAANNITNMLRNNSQISFSRMTCQLDPDLKIKNANSNFN